MGHSWQGGFTSDELDRNRVVTLTVGQLTDALADALSVVDDANPAWKKGDRAFVEVEVVATLGDRSRVSFGNGSISLPTYLLKEIEE